MIRTCLLAMALAVALIHTAGAQPERPWYEHYEQAERALQEENWTEVIERINDALEQKADSGARIRTYGMRFTEYFPYLKLGIAYYQLEQFNAALQAFETEQRLGAIADSAPYLAELEQFRTLTENGLVARREAEESRVAQIVRDSLDEASALTARGDLDAAIAVLGRAIAVDPQNDEATTALGRVRNQLAERQMASEMERRRAQLVTRGRQFLNAGRYRPAGQAFRQALALRRDDDVSTLLDTTMEGLRAELADRRDTERQAVIIDSLQRAEQHEADGQLSDALNQLQAVLALEPTHALATQIQVRIIDRQSETEQEQLRRESLTILVADLTTSVEAGAFDQVLATANRVLALDPGNDAALEYIGQAYRELGRRLLGSAPPQNIPPAIRFADLRQEMEDGLQAELVRSPRFRLSGVIIDNSPVDVTFYGGDNREVRGTTTSQSLGEYQITEFALDHELVAGTTTFRLVATDAEDLSSSSEYAVVYLVPFFRSVWFYSALALAVLTLAGATYGRRVQQRQRLLQRRFNPYVAGAPVLDPNMFFGREMLMNQILQTVHNNSLLLYGERRIGKTSLQHQLKRRLERLQDPQYLFFPVYIDLQGTPEEKLFGTLAEEVFHELEAHLDGLQPSADFTQTPAYAYRHFVQDMRKVVRILTRRASKRIRVVLLIDEVDELNNYDPRVNQKGSSAESVGEMQPVDLTGWCPALGKPRVFHSPTGPTNADPF